LPYLTAGRKSQLADPKSHIVTAGDLTYLITMSAVDESQTSIDLHAIIERYLPEQPRYENYAIVLGCIDSARREILRRQDFLNDKARSVGWENWPELVPFYLSEFADDYYRDVIAPYEDQKIEQNGDCFD
jgi:hypothetical protein